MDDDLISREAVLKGKMWDQYCNGVEIIDGKAVPVEYIEKLPSVVPKLPECEDAVSRKALYEHMEELEDKAGKRVLETPPNIGSSVNPAYIRYSAQLNERTALKHMIADAPSAVLKRKAGKWMPAEIEAYAESHGKPRGWIPWICSECGWGVVKHQTAFCPNCGAKMER